MENRITATQLARSLSDVLSRVYYRGESFIIERNGETVATLKPPETRPSVTFRELVSRLKDRNVPWPLEGFADDLEAVQASQKEIGPLLEWDK